MQDSPKLDAHVSHTDFAAGDTASFGWLCWLLLIDSLLYFVVGAYIRMVFPGKPIL